MLNLSGKYDKKWPKTSFPSMKFQKFFRGNPHAGWGITPQTPLHSEEKLSGAQLSQVRQGRSSTLLRPCAY